MSQAKTAFRKISVKSSYNRQFGERPKEEEAFHIIKKKKFSELDFAAILKSEPLRIIEKWVGVDNEEEFTARVFFTLREMYTIVRGKSIFSTTMRDHFIDKPQYGGANPPRFDLFEIQQNSSLRATASNLAIEKKKRLALINNTTARPGVKDLLKKFPFDPLMDPKATRHDDLKGDKGLMYFLNPRDPSFTHYNGLFVGK